MAARSRCDWLNDSMGTLSKFQVGLLSACSIGALVGLPFRGEATSISTLNVTNFGARGDAFETLADTVQGSTVIHVLPTNQLSAADVGKLILLFGAGPAAA